MPGIAVENNSRFFVLSFQVSFPSADSLGQPKTVPAMSFLRSISLLVDVPDTSVAAVEGAGIGDIEMTHEFAQVALRGFHQEMEMIVHKNKGVKFDGIDRKGPGKDAGKRCPVLIAPEDVPSFVSTAYWMRNGLAMFCGDKKCFICQNSKFNPHFQGIFPFSRKKRTGWRKICSVN